MITRDATAKDLPAIDRIFRQSFCDTFAHLYAAEDLAAFLAKFTPQAWANEHADHHFAFRVAEADGELFGYLKLGPLGLPVETRRPAIELKQLYLVKDRHGTGAAAALMDWSLEEARRRGAEEIYLSVYTDNPRAQRFYQRYGFEFFAPYRFMVGNHADEDMIMVKRL